MKNQSKKEQRERRHVRIRAKIFGTSDKPRLSVFKSNKHISAQIIDDENQKTLVAVHSREAKGKTMLERSAEIGLMLGSLAKQKKVKKVVFDRGGFIYTGNVKALADGARKGGLVF